MKFLAVYFSEVAAVALLALGSVSATSRSHLLYSMNVIIENQYQSSTNGLYMLQRNGDPKWARNNNLGRVKNKAAVWQIQTPDCYKFGGNNCLNEQVRYGDAVVIANQYSSNGSKGYLLQRNGGAKFTLDTRRIDNEAAMWTIQPVQGGDGSMDGEPVPLYADILIRNEYGSNQYLERNGDPTLISSPRIYNKASVFKLEPSGAGCPLREPMHGVWVTVPTSNVATEHTFSYGTTRTSEQSTNEEWAEEMTIAMTTGFDTGTSSGELSVSSTLSHSFARSFSSSFEESEEHSFTFSCDGHLFQYVVEIEDMCGGASSSSGDLACLPFGTDLPCCFPSEALDADYTTCKPGKLNLCTETYD